MDSVKERVHPLFARRRYERSVDESEGEAAAGRTVSASFRHRRRAWQRRSVALHSGRRRRADAPALQVDAWPGADRGGAPRVAACTFSSVPTRRPKSSRHGTRPTRSAIRGCCSAPRTAASARRSRRRPRTYRDAKSGSEIRINHARLTRLTPDTDYVYAAVHDGATPELGTFRTAPRGRAAFTFTSFGDQSTPTLNTRTGPDVVHQRPSRVAGGGRRHHRRRTHCAAVQPRQRRPVLRQPGRRPDPGVVGLVRQQQPLRAPPTVDACGGQPRERARQRAQSDTAPIRPISRCRSRIRTPSYAGSGTRSPRAPFG